LRNKEEEQGAKLTTQKEKADLFKTLHVKGSPLILFNIWDPGSARVLEQVGAKAIATGSWSVAAAHGFEDGEKIPLELVLANLERIVGSVALPVTLDFEGGYATDALALKENITKVIAAGAVGINFEDRIVGGDGLHTVEDQSARIRAIREAAEEASIPFFINARKDVFLRTYPAKHNENELEEAVQRGKAYTEAGASGLFYAGLRDPQLIEKACELSSLPVNILAVPDAPPTKILAQLGVARISYGGRPYRQVSEALKEAAQEALSPSLTSS
jgi:2-methylisocitrate lyase-like PEP mutase family enzyme